MGQQQSGQVCKLVVIQSFCFHQVVCAVITACPYESTGSLQYSELHLGSHDNFVMYNNILEPVQQLKSFNHKSLQDHCI